MNTKCNRLTMALYELKSQKISFICFFLISVVLLSAIISCFTLTVQIPSEMSDYIFNTGYGSLNLSNVKSTDLNQLEKMPIRVLYYDFPVIESVSLGIPYDEEFTCIIEEDSVEYELITQNSGSVLRWLSESRADTVNRLNENLTDGAEVTEAVNTEDGIWLSDNAAEYLRVGLNDTVSFKASTDEAVEVERTVKGIYTQDIYLSAFYVSQPLYNLSARSDSYSVSATVAPINMKDYYNIVSRSQAAGWSPSYDDKFIDGIMLLISVLYTFCVLMCIIEMSVIYSIAKSYYIKRKQYFAIGKAMGMSNRDILFVVCFVLHMLVSLAFVAALIAAPILNTYIVDLLNSLFSDVKITTDVFNIYTLVIYIVVSVLLWITCLISQRFYTTADIVDFLKQNDN